MFSIISELKNKKNLDNRNVFSQAVTVAFACIVKLSLLIHVIDVGQAAPTYAGHACTNSSTGTTLIRSSTYYSNRNLLLSYLTSNSTNDRGFYQTTVASGTPDAAVGLFLCRSYVTAAVCRDCVDTASREVLRRCPQTKQAIIWYDVCWIRYEDGSVFAAIPGVVPSTYMASSERVTAETDRFNQLLAGAVNAVANRAANLQSRKKFSTEEKKFTSSRTLYSLAQCTPDLSVPDCLGCFGGAIGLLPGCCVDRVGATVLLPSCFIRFEFYRFYNTTEVIPASGNGKGKGSSITIIAIIVPIVVVLVVFSVAFCFLRRKAKIKKYLSIRQNSVREEISKVDSLQFDLDEIQIATDNFSDANKIGEGGFGEVYKGTLPNGVNIAVKRLRGQSGQGAEPFKNEAVLVAKLQHRNLVRLLGFCLGGEEKILVFEYVPNGSLDHFLFDHEKQNQLDWTKRYELIGGIARGILYLHVDSRLNIIHRDLKASNILLDDDMNPKISDFGMAKVFVVDQTHGKTNRIVGTYGYMSPEYAMHGQFSVKSDVFSFGVLVLEILSGKKNNFVYQSHDGGDLLSYAWELWREGTPLELLDPRIRHSCSRNEAIRCIHMGLLCVQENPSLRPTMVTIALMLNSYSVALPIPQQPAILHHNRTQASTSIKERNPRQSTINSPSRSVNDGSMITEVYPR